MLISLVKSFGSQKWSDVAKKMPGREGKQCRERWHNHLSPSIKKTPWTPTEQWILFLVNSDELLEPQAFGKQMVQDRIAFARKN